MKRQAAIKIKIRALHAQRALIDRASQIIGKSHSDFILEAACREAENILLDQRLFLLNEQTFNAFEEILTAPVKDNPALRRLLSSTTP